jgi:choline kinase
LQAVIVAAGRGSRLRPHTDHAPKCLLSFAGRTLIDWQRAALAANGITDVTLVRGYMGQKFDDLGLSLRTNPRWAETNMVYSLFCAKDILEAGKTVVVSYGDIIYEPRVVEALLTVSGDIAVAVDRNWRALWQERSNDPLSDAESLRVGDDGRIVDIGRKVASLDEIEAQYIGLMRFDRVGLEMLCDFYGSASDGDAWLLGRTRETCYMTDLLRGMIEAGCPVMAAEIEGGWLEFDTGADLTRYDRLAASGQLAPFFRAWTETPRWSSG